MKFYINLIVLVICLCQCDNNKQTTQASSPTAVKKAPAKPAEPVANTLTENEIDDGWRLLFDGKTTKGWRNFNKKTIGSSWKVINGELTLEVEKKYPTNYYSYS